MLEEKVREAIVVELQRQAAEQADIAAELRDDSLFVQGVIDLDALATAVVGAVAGGP